MRRAAPAPHGAIRCQHRRAHRALIVGRQTAYALSCGLGLLACVAIALSPRTAIGYTSSTLFYTFVLGMLRADGWAHDRWGTNGMLYTEALVGVAALLVFALLVTRVRGSVLAPEPVGRQAGEARVSAA